MLCDECAQNDDWSISCSDALAVHARCDEGGGAVLGDGVEGGGAGTGVGSIVIGMRPSSLVGEEVGTRVSAIAQKKAWNTDFYGTKLLKTFTAQQGRNVATWGGDR